MIRKTAAIIRGNYMVILLTFELFWIMVFLLQRISSQAGNGVPRFVYVNF